MEKESVFPNEFVYAQNLDKLTLYIEIIKRQNLYEYNLIFSGPYKAQENRSCRDSCIEV